MTNLDQHNREIAENRTAWERKPVLRKAYADFYRAIAAEIIPDIAAPTVELGAGMGNIKFFLPDCITSDIFPNPWLDRVESAYALSFADNTVGHLVLFDVWHHLEFPADALAEFRRVLVPGGRVILLEPAMSPLGRLVYGSCHHEPLGFEKVFPERPVGITSIPERYFSAQSSAHRIFSKKQQPAMLDGWRLLQLQRIVSLAYFGSGGFRGRQLYPKAALPIVCFVDRIFSCFSSIFAARILVTLEKPKDDVSL